MIYEIFNELKKITNEMVGIFQVRILSEVIFRGGGGGGGGGGGFRGGGGGGFPGGSLIGGNFSSVDSPRGGSFPRIIFFI